MASRGRPPSKACTRADAAAWDWGVFAWNEPGRYPRGEALAVYSSRARAYAARDRLPADRNVVVRPIMKLQA